MVESTQGQGLMKGQMSNISNKQIRDRVIKKARSHCESVMETLTEEDCERLVQLLTDTKRLDQFLRTLYALGFKGSETEDKTGKQLGKNCQAVMVGASVYAYTLKLTNELNRSN